MKKFEINNHGVCINPNEYRICDEIKISTALIEKKWRAGNSVMFGKFGCGGAPSPKDNGFETEKECFRNESIWIEKYLENNEVKNIAFYKDLFREKMNEYFPSEIQLTLF